MKKVLLALVFAVAAAAPAYALNCNVNGVSKVCDFICAESFPGVYGCGNATTLAGCDNAPNGNGDGTCTICGVGSATGGNIITGTPSADWICSGGGNDIINAGDGNDQIDGGSDDDDIDGQGGDDYIYGNTNDDTIEGGPGWDNVDGGGGNDEITDEEGSNMLHGGSGDDTITTLLGDDTEAVFGSSLCGDGGKDTLKAQDYGIQCMDPGSGQGSTVFLDCEYDGPAQLDPHDVGATTGNCKQTAGSPLYVRTTCGCS